MTGEDVETRKRRELVAEIAAEAALTAGFTGRRSFSPRVLQALAEVPRHAFVGPAEQRLAYINAPLPIGHGQTVSQPYIVALMSDLLALEENDAVLEIGTGCGYQAAVLARLVRQVYSVEIIPALAAQAAHRLQRLGFDNVSVHAGDGYDGWPEHAPYAGVIVTAAAPAVPPPLLAQLAPGGRMTIPVGEPFYGQDLLLIEKDADGQVHERVVLPVSFVPLTGRR